MKRFFSAMMGAVVLTLMLVSLPRQKAQAQPGVSVSFQMFYDELAPYGQWIDDPNYGYVWAPEVEDDFRPYYSNGNWVMTDYGNTWASNYDWGWAPFHYGRWTFDDYYGWIWVPGDQWGPAWVNWRSGGGYYGWAPLSPGVNININFGNYYAPNDWWTFIPCQHIYSPNYYSYWRGPGYNTTIYNQTTIVNNYYNNAYVSGPRRSEIERYTGQRVNVYDLRDSRRPGRTAISNNQVALYRPRIERSGGGSGFREAPRNAIRAERPIGGRSLAGTRDGGNRVANGGAVRDGRLNSGGRTMNGSGRQQIQRDDRGVRGGALQRPDRQEQVGRGQVERGDMNASRGGFRGEREQMVNRDRGQQMQAERGRQEQIQRQQLEAQRGQRENIQRQQVERQRMERENGQRQQMERGRQEQIQRQQFEAQRGQRENIQRQQVERQRAERENVQRMQMERGRQEQMQRQQMERGRQEQMQRQQMERGRQEQMQRQQMERGRQEQMQRQQMMQQQQQQRMERPQREWRRPEPQQQMQQPQRMERPQQVERAQPQFERGGGRPDHGGGHGRR
jgi:hypothetical protein